MCGFHACCRVGFHGAGEVWTRDVLNLGVRPDTLIQTMRRKLEAAGGMVLERTPLAGVPWFEGWVGVVWKRTPQLQLQVLDVGSSQPLAVASILCNSLQ
jgi:hypothetical protein